jgi:hypothetical protein
MPSYGLARILDFRKAPWDVDDRLILVLTFMKAANDNAEGRSAGTLHPHPEEPAKQASRRMGEPPRLWPWFETPRHERFTRVLEHHGAAPHHEEQSSRHRRAHRQDHAQEPVQGRAS